MVELVVLIQIKELLKNQEIQKQTLQVSASINDCLGIPLNRIETGTLVSAYLLYKARISSKPFSISYQDIQTGELDVEPEIKKIVTKYISETALENMNKLLTLFAPDIFAATVFLPLTNLERTDGFATPESIIDLALNILNCQSGDQVADIGCGTGTFMINTHIEVPGAEFTGYEINHERYLITLMRSRLLGENITVHLQDAFSLFDNSMEMPRFDKIFANLPFGMRFFNFGNGGKYLIELKKKYPEISKPMLSQWVLNALLCDLLKEGGKAVNIITNGATYNGFDLTMRKFFVESGLIECVITLPTRIFIGSNINTSMIVFSHGNKGLRLVDASGIYRRGRRQNEFSTEDINKIILATQSDGENSRLVTLDELRQNEYFLNLSRYQDYDVLCENGVEFNTVIKNITRGASCTASQLDEMVSREETNMQFLMLSNIQNGIIDGKLPYLKKIDKKYEKYCIKNNSLIISKNGAPFKVAVAKVSAGSRIMANGNLYVIELDESKVNPYYLKSYFESKKGIETLKAIAVGNIIPSIGIDKLKRLMVPLPPLEKQNQIASKYLEVMEEISTLKVKLESAVNRLGHIFDEQETLKNK